MLQEHKLLKFLWGEAANTTVYVQNWTPHQDLGNKTPKEVFIGVNSVVGELRIFGFLVYFHVPKDKRNKLESTGRKCMFVGYFKKYKEFRIYIPTQRKF